LQQEVELDLKVLQKKMQAVLAKQERRNQKEDPAFDDES
jgi:hypothetical protein